MKTISLRKTGKYDTGDTRTANNMRHVRKPVAPSKSSVWAKRSHDITADMVTFNYTLPKHPREV